MVLECRLEERWVFESVKSKASMMAGWWVQWSVR